MSSELLAQISVCALALAGAFALKNAWSKNTRRRPALIVAGWGLFAVSVIAAMVSMGAVRGLFIGLTLLCAVGLTLAALNYDVRLGRVRVGKDVALEPSDRKRVVWRGWLRGFLAGPMAGIAAIGVGLFIAVCFSGPPQTRMVIGGLMVPFLWAGGMAWTLSDDKILRAFAVLFGVAVLSLGAAFLKGTMG